MLKTQSAYADLMIFKHNKLLELEPEKLRSKDMIKKTKLEESRNVKN